MPLESGTAERFAALEVALARVERAQRRILRLLEARHGGLQDAPELLSVRQAAKLLGRSRSRVLTPAIARGEIRTVAVGRRRLVPRNELERVLAEGIQPHVATCPARHRRPARPPPHGAAARIAAIDLDGL